MTSLFGENPSDNDKAVLEYHNMYHLGVAVGGGLFLLAVLIGVMFWMSREREEDTEIREEAEKLQGERRRRVLI